MHFVFVTFTEDPLSQRTLNEASPGFDLICGKDLLDSASLALFSDEGDYPAILGNIPSCCPSLWEGDRSIALKGAKGAK
jgi:hypothetical protein